MIQRVICAVSKKRKRSPGIDHVGKKFAADAFALTFTHIIIEPVISAQRSDPAVTIPGDRFLFFETAQITR